MALRERRYCFAGGLFGQRDQEFRTMSGTMGPQWLGTSL